MTATPSDPPAELNLSSSDTSCPKARVVAVRSYTHVCRGWRCSLAKGVVIAIRWRLSRNVTGRALKQGHMQQICFLGIQQQDDRPIGWCIRDIDVWRWQNLTRGVLLSLCTSVPDTDTHISILAPHSGYTTQPPVLDQVVSFKAKTLFVAAIAASECSDQTKCTALASGTSRYKTSTCDPSNHKVATMCILNADIEGRLATTS